jgi:hypothetical protein
MMKDTNTTIWNGELEGQPVRMDKIETISGDFHRGITTTETRYEFWIGKVLAFTGKSEDEVRTFWAGAVCGAAVMAARL